VNISQAERSGASPSHAQALAEQIRAFPALRFAGVMAIGPLTNDGSAIAEAFERAAEVFRLTGGSTLSHGMSGDWREGVCAGATMIRLGTALFGPRPTRH